MKKQIVLAFILFVTIAFAQTGPRTWRDHTGNLGSNSVARLGSKVYGSYINGLVYFEDSELNPTVLNKINGLTYVGVKLLRTNPYNNRMMVVYNNANIDVIDPAGNISNYADLKLKSISGKKYINEITFQNKLAYMSCGFGIIVFDTDKMEIKDTYYIGPNASSLEVFQIAFTDSVIYAATEAGIYKSNFKTRDLSNYKNWTLDTLTLPDGPYSGVINVGGKIMCAYAPSKKNIATRGKDTVYTLQGQTWSKFGTSASKGATVLWMGAASNTSYYVRDLLGVVVRDVVSDAPQNTCYAFNGEGGMNIGDVCIAKDFAGRECIWVADLNYGLFRQFNYYDPQTRVLINGTHSTRTAKIDVNNGRIAVAPANVDQTGVGSGAHEGVNIFQNNEWSYLPVNDPGGTVLSDLTWALFDRKDPSILWACSWYYGINKYKNDQLLSTWNTTNTPAMPSILVGEPRCSGMSMDKDGNLWVANSDRINFLSVIVRKTNEFKNFRFLNQTFVRKTIIDKSGFIWILHERDGGISVYNPKDFADPVLDVNYKMLSKDIGKGNLGDNSVYAAVEDKDGKIWVGTAQGIRVFYNPSGIFTSSDYDSQPIKIVQDGNVELLLGHEVVTSLVVDGANNKWAGTQSGGLYCFSADGQTQLYHFTKENSPLYSNYVLDVNYNEQTGDVFVSTDLGLQSFRSTILEGATNYSAIAAFPNPVRPNYQGTVLIKGLIDKTVIRIADESGNVVWETKSSGGQVEWPVQTLSGSRVSTGVYIVYASTTDGESKAVTKILVVN